MMRARPEVVPSSLQESRHKFLLDRLNLSVQGNAAWNPPGANDRLIRCAVARLQLPESHFATGLRRPRPCLEAEPCLPRQPLCSELILEVPLVETSGQLC